MPESDKEKQQQRRPIAGPVKGDFIAPPEVAEADERADALPQQEEFWRPPVRFGSVPVEKDRWAGTGAEASASCIRKSCCPSRWSSALLLDMRRSNLTASSGATTFT